MTAAENNWHPRKRLRHLQSLQARNLSGVLDGQDKGGAYFVLWSHITDTAALDCLYISEVVYGSTSPEWAPIDASHLATLPHLLHSAHSSLLHLHIYSLPSQRAGHTPSHSSQHTPNSQQAQQAHSKAAELQHLSTGQALSEAPDQQDADPQYQSDHQHSELAPPDKMNFHGDMAPNGDQRSYPSRRQQQQQQPSRSYGAAAAPVAQQLQRQWQGQAADAALQHPLPRAEPSFGQSSSQHEPSDNAARSEVERRSSLSLSDIFKWPSRSSQLQGISKSFAVNGASERGKERGALPTSDSAESMQDSEHAHADSATSDITRQALACCKGMRLPGKLQLATSLDLAALQRLARDAQAVAAMNLPYPPNTVLLEMGDGIYAQPGMLDLPDAAAAAEQLQALEQPRSSSTSAMTAAAEEPQGTLPGVLRALLWRSAAPTVEGGTPSRVDDESSQQMSQPTVVLPEHASSPPATLRFLQSQGAAASPIRHIRSASFTAASAGFTPLRMSPQDSGASELLSKVTFPLNRAAATAETPPEAQEVDMATVSSTMCGLEAVQRRLQEQLQRCSALQQRLEDAVKERQDRQCRHQQLRQAHRKAVAQRQLQEAADSRTQLLTKRAAATQAVLAVQRQALAAAHTALKAARVRLGNAEGLLEGQGRRERWAGLQARVTSRRCALASSLGALFSLGPQAVLEPCAPSHGFVWDLLEAGWEGGADGSFSGDSRPASPAHPTQPHTPASQKAGHDRGDSTDRLERLATAWFQGSCAEPALEDASTHSSNMYRETAMLAIGGLYLPPALYRDRPNEDVPNPLDSDPEQTRRTASALGYVAHVTALLGLYLDIPLRYPVRAAESKSAVLDAAAPASRSGVMRKHLASDSGRAMVLLSRSQSRAVEAELAATAPPPTEFPLHATDGTERTRFAYAAFLLNKDVEQLLDAHGLTSSGPSALLANLYKLVSAAASGLPASSAQHAALVLG